MMWRTRPTKAVARLACRVLVALLVIHHAVLLWQRVATQTLFDPAVALRWAATLGLLLAFLRLRRTGISLVWGHKAVAMWLLVLLLHVSFSGPLADSTESTLDLTPGSGLLLAIPATGAVVALLLTLLRLVFLSRRDRTCTATLRSNLVEVEANPSRRESWLPQLSCRPPPSQLPSTP